ncbi:hypothetical protein A3F02_03800 [Candidatus Curtissbacteria bacterium RIFCSPHIGHO2_12_FULL_38_9b]|uniref:O-antigen ligase-related domain-containing protein n=1 Tax=Candidatus Curtissbacteria bacterium RIFCSPHIGHO2_12_FULL_38_9b TaxID=1797720 RepID=A0A1F5GST6_9BACT|nr:MAG: hypothetical protein A3F02_03800 [Candidatus Curtissbacteria bacterium RIFCSPHIGHO2_12_FULL_38_9b]
MDYIKVLLILTIATIIPGQLIRLPIFSLAGAVTATDIFVFLSIISFSVYSLFFKKSIKFPQKITLPLLFFCIIALASAILALEIFSTVEIITSLYFLVRFIAYFLVSIVIYNVVSKGEIIKWLNVFLIIGSVFIVFGFFQFIFFPDLTVLTFYGWDPHQNRLVSTVLDPNFAGGILIFISAVSVSLFLYFKKFQYLIIFIISFAGIILTFSRSSYLAFITLIIIIGFIKSPKLLIITFLIFLTAFLTIGQVKSRLIGALTLDDTALARIKSWQNSLVIFRDNPIIGVGFNTYRLTQARYGLFTYDDPQGGHSGAGVDSSILLVAVTTGILGLFFYLVLILSIIKLSFHNIRSNTLNLAFFSSLIGIIIHSQFVNSLFFPQIMLLIWFFTGLVLKSND